MPRSDIRRTLFEWYDTYVGEAATRREVYGYWTFVVGYTVGIAGVLVFLLGPGTPNSPAFLAIREVAIVLSALGLALGLLGIAFQLPVSRVGVWTGIVGAAVSLFAIGYFTTVYPHNWLGPDSPQRTVIAIYVAGVALIAGVAVLVPVLTGERSFLFDRDRGDRQDILIGEADRGGLFAVYRRGPADWRWRLLEQEAVADGTGDFASRPDAESAVEAVRSDVADAGLLEINTAAFRLYGGDGSPWHWDLLTEDGAALATGATTYDRRDDAEEAVAVLKEYGPDADVLEVDGAAFRVERAGTNWDWRLVDERREPLARAPDTHDAEDDAVSATGTFAAAAGDADVLAVDGVGFEVRETDAGWTWRAVDSAGAELAAGTAVDGERSAARDRVDAVRDRAAEAPVTVATEAHVELVPAGQGWTWRLHEGGEVHAEAHGDPADREDAAATVDAFRETAPDAEIIDGGDAAVELYREEGDWAWRYVAADRTELQRGARTYPTREDAEAAVEHAVATADAAEIVEFEEAAFQLYEADGGDWRWRLIEEGGELLADSGEDYDTRDAAASGMQTLKENAPDADLLEIDDAAVELFREDGEWGWRLVDEAGELVATGQTRHPSKTAAKSAAAEMQSSFEAPESRTVGDGAFQVLERADGGDWHWRFVGADGDVLADGPRGHTTRERAVRAVETVQAALPDAATVAVETMLFVVGPDDGEWGWRLLDTDREPLAASTPTYDDREAATEAVEGLRTGAADAEVFELTGPVYRVDETDAGWRWTLVDADWTPLADGPGAFEDRDAAERAVGRVRELAPDADRLEYDDAAFELAAEDGGWGWRLVDEDERVLATSPVRYDDREAATAALDDLRAVVGAASVLEIETASFEIHETADESGWEWRLVDRRGETVARSVTTYETRTAAREGMQTLKQRSADAGVVVAG